MNSADEPPGAETRDLLLGRALAREELAVRVRKAKEDKNWPAALSLATLLAKAGPSDPAAELVAMRLLARGVVSLAGLVTLAGQVRAGAVDPNEVL